MPAAIRASELRLLYPPHQAWPGYMCKPDASLPIPIQGAPCCRSGLRCVCSTPAMVNASVPPAELEDIRRGAWERVGHSKFIRHEKEMNAAESNDLTEAAVSKGS